MSSLEYQTPNHYFKERDNAEYPIRRSDKIEPGKTYRTRDGSRVKVYAVEKEIHGAILVGSEWKIDSWKLDGTYLNSKGKDHPRDIRLSPPLEIRLGAKYKSRDGRPIQIFAINKNSTDFPIVGGIRDELGNWLPRVYNTKGVCKVPYGPNNDIVAEWSQT